MPLQQAAPDDVRRLVELMDEFYAEGGFKLHPQRATDAFAALTADERLGRVWFIQAEERDVGYVAVTYSFSLEFGGLCARIDDFFVRQAFRGQGLGTATLTEVRAVCEAQGIRALHVETSRDYAAAQAVYRRVGFTSTDRELLVLPLANPLHEPKS